MIRRRCGTMVLAGFLSAMLTLTACESDNNPYGIPYDLQDRLLPGVYAATSPADNLGMRLVLGSRGDVTGRYDGPSGGVIRFAGTWERRGSKLFVAFEPQPGLPDGIEFDFARETVLTEIPRSPFSMIPENAPPRFLEQDIMRLSGPAIVAGRQLALDLVRIITDIVGGGNAGGLGRS